MEKLWVVYRLNGSPPKQVHSTVKAAKDEAERVCRKEGGQVHIMETVAVCRTAPVPVEWEC